MPNLPTISLTIVVSEETKNILKDIETAVATLQAAVEKLSVVSLHNVVELNQPNN